MSTKTPSIETPTYGTSINKSTDQVAGQHSNTFDKAVDSEVYLRRVQSLPNDINPCLVEGNMKSPASSCSFRFNAPNASDFHALCEYVVSDNEEFDKLLHVQEGRRVVGGEEMSMEEELSAVSVNTDQVIPDKDQIMTDRDQGFSDRDQRLPVNDQVVLDMDQAMSNTDQNTNDNISSCKDQLSSTDQAILHSNQLSSNTDHLILDSDQLSSSTDQLFLDSNQLSSNTDQLFLDSDQLSSSTDQLFLDSNQLSSNTDQIILDSDQLSSNTDKPMSDITQITSRADQVAPNLLQRKTHFSANPKSSLATTYQLCPVAKTRNKSRQNNSLAVATSGRHQDKIIVIDEDTQLVSKPSQQFQIDLTKNSDGVGTYLGNISTGSPRRHGIALGRPCVDEGKTGITQRNYAHSGTMLYSPTTGRPPRPGIAHGISDVGNSTNLNYINQRPRYVHSGTSSLFSPTTGSQIRVAAMLQSNRSVATARHSVATARHSVATARHSVGESFLPSLSNNSLYRVAKTHPKPFGNHGHQFPPMGLQSRPRTLASVGASHSSSWNNSFNEMLTKNICLQLDDELDQIEPTLLAIPNGNQSENFAQGTILGYPVAAASNSHSQTDYNNRELLAEKTRLENLVLGNKPSRNMGGYSTEKQKFNFQTDKQPSDLRNSFGTSPHMEQIFNNDEQSAWRSPNEVVNNGRQSQNEAGGLKLLNNATPDTADDWLMDVDEKEFWFDSQEEGRNADEKIDEAFAQETPQTFNEAFACLAEFTADYF